MFVLITNADTEFGIVPADTAAAEAQKIANETGKTVTLRDPTTNKVKKTVKPKITKSAKAPKATKANGKGKPAHRKATAAPKKAAPKAPKGMVVEILKLASRKNGVSPQELNDLTTWKGAPWKWLFANPKGTGYCDRWGYTLNLLPGEGPRSVRYQVAKVKGFA